MARKITEISPLRTFLGGFLISVHSITAVSLAIMIIGKSKEVWLLRQKYYLALTTEEWRLMIEPLNNLRNRLVSEGRYTVAVNDYLADLKEQAEAMFSQLVKLLAGKKGVTEVLKAENQMLWVQKMNNFRNAAMEIVTNELIYR